MTEGTTEALTGVDSQSLLKVISRAELYALIWREPMLHVGSRFGVSSSYMARVCTELRVPRPPRGYWAQLEFGKAPAKPDLPQARPGDAIEWKPGTSIGTTQRSMPDLPEPVVRAVSRMRKQPPQGARHSLLAGVKPFFLKTRESDTGLLRPFKRLLVDIVASEKHLDAALDTADVIFRALAAKGHRVTLAPSDARMPRGEVDAREVPKSGHYHRSVWTPDRPTVAYIGEIPIGLTLFEMTEVVDVMHVNGAYIPIRDLTPDQLRRYKRPQYWTTTRDLASGRLCLQAYCPSSRVSWTRQWREAKAGQLLSQVPAIVRELEAAGPELAGQLEEARRHAEEQRIKWEEDMRRHRETAERARQVKARQDARTDLLSAISAWDEALRIEKYFSAAESALGQLPESEQLHVRDRLSRARSLVGEVDALEYLRRWKAPEER